MNLPKRCSCGRVWRSQRCFGAEIDVLLCDKCDQPNEKVSQGVHKALKLHLDEGDWI